MKPKVLVVAGTRPEIVKLESVIKEFEQRKDIEMTFVLSGQHYDYELCKQFIEELDLPSQDENLKIGSGTHNEQTGRVLIKLKEILEKHQPSVVLAQGDTNTVAATGLSAVKQNIPFAHVEAGLRNYDRTMAEEINRMMAAVTAELHFAPTQNSALNLLYEGVPPEKIFITGNPIVDAVSRHVEENRAELDLGLRTDLDEQFIVATIHRERNVEEEEKLREIVKSLVGLSIPIIFPIHPRTQKKLKEFGLEKKFSKNENIITTKPLGYIDFLKLLSSSNLAITDSGGIQEEALTLDIPCVTIRASTERPETIETGANTLVEPDSREIIDLVKKNFSKGGSSSPSEHNEENPLGDGKAGERIADVVEEKCSNGFKLCPPEFYETGSAYFSIREVDSTLDGLSIQEIQEKNSGFSVTLVYNENGKPVFPHPALELEEGWRIRLFGPDPTLR